MKNSFLVLIIFVVGFTQTRNFSKERSTIADLRFQQSSYYQTLSLNYVTLATSVLWIRSMIGFGEDLRRKRRNPAMSENGIVMASLDPRFIPIYNWFSAVQMNKPTGPTYKDFENVDELMKIGVATNDLPSLNYSAAMNHIGFNRNLTNAQKRHFFQVGAEFLRPILHHPEANPRVVSIFRYLRGGGHFRDKVAPADEAQYLSTILSGSSKEAQIPILNRLKELGYSNALFEKRTKEVNEFNEAKKKCCDYFPDDFATAYGFRAAEK